MKMLFKLCSAVLPSLFICLLPFQASAEVKDMAKTVADAAFSEAERQVIEKYYELRGRKDNSVEESPERDDTEDDDKQAKSKGKGKNKSKGKGKNKKKAMPKGIAMKLERGGTMPPGIARTRLPDELEQQLPPPPSGFERIKSEGKVVLAEVATGVIADIIKLGKPSTSTDRTMKKTEASQEVQAEKNNSNDANDNKAEVTEKKWWQIWK